MVTFKGVSLDTVAPVKITDIVVGAPTVETATKQNPIARGERFVRRKYSPRLITISFYFQMSTPKQRHAWLENLNKWADSGTPDILRIPHYEGKYINAVCTKLPDFSAVIQRNEMQIEFTAHDPAFLSDEIKEADCGNDFSVGGSFPALVYIQQTNATAVNDPTWILDTAHVLALSGSIGAGTIKVDLENRWIYLNSMPIMDKFNQLTKFFDIVPGTHHISGSGKVFYQERWI